jgi:hypothetical protein
MTVKSIVIELEVEYLQRAAKERGLSRAKLVRLLMQKVIRDELVQNILGDDDLSEAEPSSQRYRRFRNRVGHAATTPRRASAGTFLLRR